MSFFEKLWVSVKSTFLEKYATFSGRASRAEYWYFALANCLVSGVLYELYNATGFKLFSLLSSLYSLAVFVPCLAVSWRRLHDIGKKGSAYLFILIPLVGLIMVIVWFVRAGDPDENMYGPVPVDVWEKNTSTYYDNTYL